MMLHVFSVLDLKAQLFMRPFYEQSHGTALRAFSDAVIEDGHPFGKHPEDYHLFFLGSFDEETASFNTCVPEPIAKAIDFTIPQRGNGAAGAARAVENSKIITSVDGVEQIDEKEIHNG